MGLDNIILLFREMLTYLLFKNFRSPCFELSGTLTLQLFSLILYESTSSISYVALFIFIIPPKIPPAIAAGGAIIAKKKGASHLSGLSIETTAIKPAAAKAAIFAPSLKPV